MRTTGRGAQKNRGSLAPAPSDPPRLESNQPWLKASNHESVSGLKGEALVPETPGLQQWPQHLFTPTEEVKTEEVRKDFPSQDFSSQSKQVLGPC